MPDASSALNRATADITLTRDAREDLERASGAASKRGAAEPRNLDVLRALLANRGSLAVSTLRQLGADPAAVSASLPEDGAAPSVTLRQLLVNANREAQVLGHHQVDSIHLLLAMLYSDSPATSGPLQTAGLTMYDLRRHLQTGTTAAAGSIARGAAPDRALRRRPWPRLRGALGVSPVFLGLLGLVVASGALLWLNVLPNYIGPLTLVFVATGWIASVCVHEFFHALVAYLGGDQSMTQAGYLTLDPLRYTNIVMSVVFPAVFLLVGGVALPGGAVYINRGALRSKWWDSAVSLAGPVGTFACGLLVAAIFIGSYLAGLFTRANTPFFEALAVLGSIEMYALVLNLVPIPPLDGFGVIRPWLPYSVQAWAARIGMYGLILLFLAIWYVPTLNLAFVGAGNTLAAIFGIDPTYVYFGQQHFRLR